MLQCQGLFADGWEERLRARAEVESGEGVGEREIERAGRKLGVVFPGLLREYLWRFGVLELGDLELLD